MAKALRRATRRGLVIGAGAALGGAWAVGALCALDEVEGFDPRECELVVGTSAGSVLAALVGCGVTPQRMADLMSGAAAIEDVEGTGPVNPFDVPEHNGAAAINGDKLHDCAQHDHVHHALADIPRPVPFAGNLLLAARTVVRPTKHTIMTAAAALAPRGRGSLAPVAELISDHVTGPDWPASPRIWVVAMDYDSGRRVVFGRSDAPDVPLPAAVTASCAAPGFFPPVTIDRHRYVDGGSVSVTNADVLLREELDEVIVLAPMAMCERDHPGGVMGRLERRLRGHVTRRMNAEVNKLMAAGMTVRVLAPVREDLEVMGANVMNPTRRHEVYETALRTTRERLLVHAKALG